MDIVVWPLAKDGKYTCKYGYRFLKEEVEFEWHEGSVWEFIREWNGIEWNEMDLVGKGMEWNGI